MEEQFLAAFSQFTTLSKEEKTAIVKSMETQDFKKGAFLLKEGELAINSYFVLEGCVREYLLNDGEERTTNFFTESQWVMSFSDFEQPSPSTHFWECSEDTKVVMGNEEKAQELFSAFPRLETLSRRILEKAMMDQKDTMTAYFTDSPEERYQKLLETRPNLAQRVPQYQLASFIGVKPESLSRIRKRLAKSQ